MCPSWTLSVETLVRGRERTTRMIILLRHGIILLWPMAYPPQEGNTRLPLPINCCLAYFHLNKVVALLTEPLQIAPDINSFSP